MAKQICNAGTYRDGHEREHRSSWRHLQPYATSEQTFSKCSCQSPVEKKKSTTGVKNCNPLESFKVRHRRDGVRHRRETVRHRRENQQKVRHRREFFGFGRDLQGTQNKEGTSSARTLCVRTKAKRQPGARPRCARPMPADGMAERSETASAQCRSSRLSARMLSARCRRRGAPSRMPASDFSAEMLEGRRRTGGSVKDSSFGFCPETASARCRLLLPSGRQMLSRASAPFRFPDTCWTG